MFPDSDIAKQFDCGPSKNSYICSFGLAPYCEDKLYDNLNNATFYSVSFDESYDNETKN